MSVYPTYFDLATSLAEPQCSVRGGATLAARNLSVRSTLRVAERVTTRAFQFAIRIYSIRDANRFESIRFVKTKIGLSIH